MLKPASRPIAKAVHAGRTTFHAQFALPGLTPEFVSRNGRPVEFHNDHDAKYAALEAMFDLLTSRTVDTRPQKPHQYVKLTGARFAELLAEAGVSPTMFAELTNVRQSRVLQWIDGEQDIPHYITLVAHALTDKTFLDLARSLVARYKGNLT